jgi:diguanylate cyclase (GGDEF)-like protein/PAS domain S-box-containing protein
VVERAAAGESTTDLDELRRAALEGFGGGFALMRAHRRDGRVDWELLFANDFVQRRWLGTLPAPGARLGEDLGDDRQEETFGRLQSTALASGTRQEAAMLLEAPAGAAWRRVVSIPVAEDVVASLTYDISDVIDLQARAAALSEHVWDVVAITDAEARLTWVSQSAERSLGYAPADLVGRPASELIYDADVDAAMGRFAEVLADPQSAGTPLEIRIVRADGAPHWFECVGINKVDDPHLAGLVVSLHDIDARKQSEAALRASEARTRSIVETAGDGIVTLDANGLIETFNHAAERMFGARAADVIGRSYPDLIPDSSVEHLRAHFALLDGAATQPTVVTARHRDGAEFPVQVSLSSTTIDGSTLYTAIVRDITRQRQIEEQLQHMALRDDLTGLPNRRAIVERLRAVLARPAATAGHVVGVLYLDLDDFKLVNDTLGQDVGDRLLTLVAKRIAGAIDHADVLARPGGDEFIVLCDLRQNVRTIARIAANIARELRAPFVVGRHEIFVTASVGIATSGSDAQTSLELLRNADTAMHRAKQRGRGHIERFDQAMRIELTARLGLESSLQRALERDELRALYQPIVELATGRVAKQEALVRWLRPGNGMVPPDEFIRVAEETGLIAPIGEWMLHRATADAAAWQDVRPGVGVAVNVSGRQLDRSDLTSAVARALRSSGLEPHLLTLEVTESVLVRDEQRMLMLLEELRGLGVRLAIDDFGTGYSSLTYLHRLPINELKIDGSFIQSLDPDGDEHPLVRMMVQLGAALGFDTVAEHIDSAHKADVLRRMGCTYGQGFHFARPTALG